MNGKRSVDKIGLSPNQKQNQN